MYIKNIYIYTQIWEAGVAACSFETRMSLNRGSRTQARPKRPSRTILNASNVGYIHNIRKTEQYTNGIHLPKSKQVDPSNWDFLHVPFHWHPFEQVPKPTSSVSSSGSGWESYPREPTQTWFMGSKPQPKYEKTANRDSTWILPSCYTWWDVYSLLF